jgi:hypothetical protein
MPRSDVLTISVLFLGVAMSGLLWTNRDWVFLLVGIGLMVLYVCMGRFRVIIHYAGWGKGPNDGDLYSVTSPMQAYVDSGKPDVRASVDFFGEHYVSPRMLKVVYSRGRWGEEKTRLFVEHEIVRLV